MSQNKDNNSIDLEQESVSESESESQNEPFPMLDEPELLGGVLNSILANYLEYEHGDGTTLNLAEAILLVRQSINENTEAVKSLVDVCKQNLNKQSQ